MSLENVIAENTQAINNLAELFHSAGRPGQRHPCPAETGARP